MTDRLTELAARAARRTVSYPPARDRSHWGTAAAAIATVVTAIGTSIVVPLLTRPPPQDTSGLAPRTVTTDLASEIASARATCGQALVLAQDAKSQASATNARLDSYAATKRPSGPGSRAKLPALPAPPPSASVL